MGVAPEEALRKVHATLCGVLDDSEETLRAFSQGLLGCGIIDRRVNNAVFREGGLSGANKLVTCIELMVEQNSELFDILLKEMEKHLFLKEVTESLKQMTGRTMTEGTDNHTVQDDAVAISSKKRRVSPGAGKKAYVVGSIKVTADHLPLLNEKLFDLHPEWDQFGTALYLNEVVIEGIKSRASGNDEKRKKLQKALVKWKRNGGQRTWRVIHSALLKIKRKDMADVILAKHPNLDSDVPYDDDGYVAIMTEALVDVISEWELFAQQLGLSNASIQEIKGDSQSPGTCFNQLLQEWIRLKGSEANIVCILEACKRMGNTELADKLRTDKDILHAFPAVLTEAEQ